MARLGLIAYQRIQWSLRHTVAGVSDIGHDRQAHGYTDIPGNEGGLQPGP